MQFVSNGPDIPNALLQAHEEGRVVFFCGAGISYPAGLPGFAGLVEQIYQSIGTQYSANEQEAFNNERYDVTLDLLERRLPKQREGLAMRKALANVLKPKLNIEAATDTHSSLLGLAKSREGALRLVTTNFDRLFHAAAKQPFQSYCAPMMPIPKNNRWNGVVYLHGLLPEVLNDETALNQIVVTSGDFGLAYLVERWAARFASELFRNYVVCFVGYSLNDPVLRYMMDALAADRMMGVVTPQAWVLTDCKSGEEQQKIIEWEVKGVKPILYQLTTSNDHSVLHQTLQKWANTYRDGVLGKESIVGKHALSLPMSSTQQENFIGRMMWALSDKSALPAKHFAELIPPPPLDWLLGPFSEQFFGYGDLPDFGVHPQSKVNDALSFSLIQRPAPYELAPQMMLASNGREHSKWDGVMFQLSRWLLRYLDDPQLILWVVQRGGQLHPRMTEMIEDKLNEYSLMERNNNTEKLEEIRSQSPKAIPGTLMRTLWMLLIGGKVKNMGEIYIDPYRWKRLFEQNGPTVRLRQQLRQLIAPKLRLSETIPIEIKDDIPNQPTRMSQLLNVEVVLNAEHVFLALRDIDENLWKTALPLLLEDFQQLLIDTLVLLNEIGDASDPIDPSLWHLPSISPHPQNRVFQDWVHLIEYLRDAWLELRSSNNRRAVQIAMAWFELPFPTFKRLALFAASQDDSIPPDQWVGWLLNDDALCLWSMNFQREVCRLLVLQGNKLEGNIQERLEVQILTGPISHIYDNLKPELKEEFKSESVWIRLCKLKESGLVLGKFAEIGFNNLLKSNPQIQQLGCGDRVEFIVWSENPGVKSYVDKRIPNEAPRNRKELVQWLKKPPPESNMFFKDTWGDVCGSRFYTSLFALCDLAREDVWPAKRWGQALNTWSEEKMIIRSWRWAAPVVLKMPDTIFQEIAKHVTWWIQIVSNTINVHEDILLKLCNRVMDLPTKDETEVSPSSEFKEKPVSAAINHPIGQATLALVRLFFKKCPNDNDQIPSDIKQLFTMICREKESRLRHGRVILGSQLITLFRVDRSWTEKDLVPFFSWSNLDEAKGMWESFLRSPRLYSPLMLLLKPDFLNCAKHYDELGDYPGQFASLLTLAALEGIEGYSEDDFRVAMQALPQAGLEVCALNLVQALNGAGNQGEDYWKNRVLPLWKNVWPKSFDRVTPRMTDLLIKLTIAARSEFPVALDAVKDWINSSTNLLSFVPDLYISGLCAQFPEAALVLLNTVICDQRWVPQELGLCLVQIVKEMPHLARDTRYQKIETFWRMNRWDG